MSKYDRRPHLIDLSAPALRVIDAILGAGGRPLLVGGAVRDALIAEYNGTLMPEPKDLDIEVYGLTGEQLLTALQKVGSASLVGQSFAVILVRVDGEAFDVSLPRRDVKTGSGHRGFTVHTDGQLAFAEASSRRDFTINAIAWDPTDGAVLDAHGGLDDLHAGVLRHVSQAFDEDPERVLRAVRFAGRLGYTIAPDTVRLCRSLRGEYATLPVERIWKEWVKIAVEAIEPSASLTALRTVGWDQHFPPLAAALANPDAALAMGRAADVAARRAAQDRLNDEQRVLVVLAAMFHQLGAEAVRELLTQLRAPGLVIGRVSLLVGEVGPVSSGVPSAADVRRLLRRLDARGRGVSLGLWAAVYDAVHAAGNVQTSPPGPAEQWVSIAGSFPTDRSVLTPLLTGEDLIRAGLRPGPHFAPILATALRAQDAGDFTDEASATEWLRRYVPGLDGFPVPQGRS